MNNNEYKPDNLIAGDFPTIVKEVTVVSASATLPRGAVLGMITVSKKYALATSAATDGSQSPKVILAEELSSGTGDRTALAYTTGLFAKEYMTFGEGLTAETTEDDLHIRSIFLADSI